MRHVLPRAGGNPAGPPRPGLTPRALVAQWHRLSDVADDAATYWQIGATTFQQTCIPGGVQWTPWPPGEYEEFVTKERMMIMAETPAGTTPGDENLIYECRLQVYRSVQGEDSHRVVTHREWGDLTRAQVLFIEHAEYNMEGALLAKADEVGAAHGVTPVPPPAPAATGWPHEPA